MLRIAICEDREKDAQWLCTILEKQVSEEHVVTYHKTVPSLQVYIEEAAKGNIDILLIDTVVGEDDGVRAACDLNRRFPQIKVIFMTGDLGSVCRIFEADPIFLLIKPYTEQTVLRGIEKARSMIESDRSRSVLITTKTGTVSLFPERIRYLESHDKIVIIHEQSNSWEARNKLDDFLDERFPGFLRCHQSYAVNMEYILRFGAEAIELYGGELIPISRSKQKEARDRFMTYIGGFSATADMV